MHLRSRMYVCIIQMNICGLHNGAKRPALTIGIVKILLLGLLCISRHFIIPRELQVSRHSARSDDLHFQNLPLISCLPACPDIYRYEL